MGFNGTNVTVPRSNSYQWITHFNGTNLTVYGVRNGSFTLGDIALDFNDQTYSARGPDMGQGGMGPQWLQSANQPVNYTKCYTAPGNWTVWKPICGPGQASLGIVVTNDSMGFGTPNEMPVTGNANYACVNQNVLVKSKIGKTIWTDGNSSVTKIQGSPFSWCFAPGEN